MMGSQALDIFRQGIWASLTGGWFYDPQQNVFCNALHLYIWLFFLCTPFLTYLYFPKTFLIWGTYSIVTSCIMVILKGINMILHVLYDRTEIMPDSCLKSSDSDCPGIELQVLSKEGVSPSEMTKTINEHCIRQSCQSSINGRKESMMDLEVDVHRRNSTASNVNVYENLEPTNEKYKKQKCESTSNHTKANCDCVMDNDFEVRPGCSGLQDENMSLSPVCANSFEEVDENQTPSTRTLNFFNYAHIAPEQSFHNEISEIENVRPQLFRSPKQQMQNCEAEFQRSSHRSASENSFHDRRRVTQNASCLYSGDIYLKSESGIESLEHHVNKFGRVSRKQIRKKFNNTMSTLQLSGETANSNHTDKRQDSNTDKNILNKTSGVRRAKSSALEMSHDPHSMSNILPHPSSTDIIVDKKRRENKILLPYNQSFTRNYLDFCHGTDICLNIEKNGTDIQPNKTEQIGNKNVEDYNSLVVMPSKENASHVNKFYLEIDTECKDFRPRTDSMNYDTDVIGSCSPLLDSRANDNEKNFEGLQSIKNIEFGSKYVNRVRKRSGDSKCPSDCGQVRAGSKDLLLNVNRNSNLRLTNVKDNGENYFLDKNTLKNQSSAIIEKDLKSLGAIPKTPKQQEDIITLNNICKDFEQQSPDKTSPATSSRSLSFESFSNEIYKPHKGQWFIVGRPKNGNSSHSMLPITYVCGDTVLSTHPKQIIIDSHYKLTPILKRSNATKRRKRIDDLLKDEGELSITLDSENDDRTPVKNDSAFSITDFVQVQYDEQFSLQHLPRRNLLNIGRNEFNGSSYCDYWRSCDLTIDKSKPVKRCYKYRFKCFGDREMKIEMDRLQLLALFDRDLNWLHVVFASLLSLCVCSLGSLILNAGMYQDIGAFIFCLVIAGSQYSLLKSVQPDAASPVHGFNKTVAYSRPIYFCLFCSLLLALQCVSNRIVKNENWGQMKSLRLFGMSVVSEISFKLLLNTVSTILLLFPILFSFGLFPQFDTFCMYSLEQFDMHIFGGNAVCNLMASMLGVAKSIIAVCILYGPIYGALAEKRGTQHVLFSIFCGGLVSLSYHLSRCSSDFSHIWFLIKSSLFSYADEENISDNIVYKSDDESERKNEPENSGHDKTNEKDCKNIAKNSSLSIDDYLSDPLQKKLQKTINNRLKNDLLVGSFLGLLTFALHCTTVFTALQPDLNGVLFSIACTLGFILHYLLPQMRKHLPWLCFAQPILKPNEYGRFEVSEAPQIMWFEQIYVYLCFLEKNVLYPLIFISVLTADSHKIINKFGLTFGSVLIAICALKAVRAAYSDCANQYLIVAFCVLLFKFDFNFASETFLLDYFVLSILHRKLCDFLLKMQFILTYIAPWQITWGSAFHAFAQPFSVPHSAMLFLQAVISAFLSTPLNPFLGSAIFLTSYVRPIKFWERDYNTKRIDHSNIRLSTQLERDLGADDNNLNSIFYEHLTRSLQHSLCGDLLLGRWGNVNQGDCFVLASDYLNCLVHIIELGNGLCTFQIRGLEFRGTYCQQREVEAISEGIEDNDGCCCCSLGHLPNILSPNAIFSTRWLAWQVVAAQYVLEGYSISENLATATLQLFEFRKVLITYYIKSIIYYVVENPKLEEWLGPGPIKDALDSTLNRQFVDLDPVFNNNLDEDFDFRANGITRSSFCCVYLNWIQFCYSKCVPSKPTNVKHGDEQNSEKHNCAAGIQNSISSIDNSYKDGNGNKFPTVKEGKRQIEKSVNKDSLLVSLCLALGLLARRSLATACHGSLSGVEFFLHGLHALFKGDFRITSPRDEWVFADMDLLHSVVAPAVKMGLKLHQDHFSSPDEYLDPAILYDAIRTHTKELVISHEADPQWRNAVLRGAPNLLALRHIMEDGSDEYRIIRLTKRFLSFRVIKLNRECVRGLWAGQQQELIYLRNRNPERGSIQNAKQALRNIINSSCDQPIGYPIYVSSLTTSYAETNQQICSLIGGSISISYIQCLLLRYWQRVKQRCHEGCSSGNSVLDSDVTYEVPGTYFLSSSAGNASNFSVQNFNSSNRSTLINTGKPSSSNILTGFLNREKDVDGDNTRDRQCKKNITLLLNEKVQFDNISKFPSTLSNEEISTRNLLDNSCKTNDNLRVSSNFSDYSPQTNTEIPRTSSNMSIFRPNIHQGLVDINKKVIIVDGMEIYDCLDLGRRIDVIWPHESMRSNGGRSSWKDWSPKEGMVGFVVHYWQPNHPDQRFRSNVNRTLYLIAIGDRFVPIGEHGIEECKENSLDFGSNKQSDMDIYLGSATQVQQNDCDVD